jgi:hypothetical protein
MAIKLPFKFNAKTVALILSILLNILGGTGTVQPLLDQPDALCPPLPSSPSLGTEPLVTPPAGLPQN